LQSTNASSSKSPSGGGAKGGVVGRGGGSALPGSRLELFWQSALHVHHQKRHFGDDQLMQITALITLEYRLCFLATCLSTKARVGPLLVKVRTAADVLGLRGSSVAAAFDRPGGKRSETMHRLCDMLALSPDIPGGLVLGGRRRRAGDATPFSATKTSSAPPIDTATTTTDTRNAGQPLGGRGTGKVPASKKATDMSVVLPPAPGSRLSPKETKKKKKKIAVTVPPPPVHLPPATSSTSTAQPDATVAGKEKKKKKKKAVVLPVATTTKKIRVLMC